MPALNEAATIAAIVTGAAPYGLPVVIDDGSRDATGELAASAGAEVVRHAVNRGYDEAINTGFARAAELRCEYVVTLDADGQHDPARVETFVQSLDAGADVVVGVRDRRARLAESIFGLVARLRWRLRDPLCGMKAYRIGVWRELGHFDSYGSIGTELALFAVKRGKRVVQLQVPTTARADRPRFGRRFDANRRILRALWIGMTRPARPL